MDKSFENIKAFACKVPILHHINAWNPDPIWVITDVLKSGISAMYGQGPEWKTCRPAGFLLKKFSATQQHYKTHEHETITMIKALMKWEDKLLGCKFTLVTDHKGLKYFETQKNLSDQQVRWWEFLSHFNFNTIHIDGAENKIADYLSYYFKNNTNKTITWNSSSSMQMHESLDRNMIGHNKAINLTHRKSQTMDTRVSGNEWGSGSWIQHKFIVTKQGQSRHSCHCGQQSMMGHYCAYVLKKT